MQLNKLANNLGQGTVVRLDGPRNMPLLDKIGTEKHESVRWTRNIALGRAFSRWVPFTDRLLRLLF